MPAAELASANARGPTTRGFHFRRLTSLRAVAALFVFAVHTDHRWTFAKPVTKFGFTGVAFFFVLSGFVLAWSFDTGRSKAAFYLRRFARIYPSYLVMLVVAALVPIATSAVTVRAALPDVVLLQSWLPDKINPYTLNGVSWSLSCEVAFYAALPFVMPRLLRMTTRQRWSAAVGYWGAASAAVIATAVIRHAQDAAYVWPPIRFGEFLLGAVAAIEVGRGWRPRASALAVIAALGLVTLIVGGEEDNRFTSADIGATMIFFAVVVGAAGLDFTHPNGLMTKRWVVYGGQISYAFYLVHQLVILNLGDHYGYRSWTSVPVLLAAAIVAAMLLHHLVERPFERRIRGLKLRGRERVADTPLPVDG